MVNISLDEERLLVDQLGHDEAMTYPIYVWNIYRFNQLEQLIN